MVKCQKITWKLFKVTLVKNNGLILMYLNTNVILQIYIYIYSPDIYIFIYKINKSLCENPALVTSFNYWAGRFRFWGFPPPHYFLNSKSYYYHWDSEVSVVIFFFPKEETVPQEPSCLLMVCSPHSRPFFPSSSLVFYSSSFSSFKILPLLRESHRSPGNG